MKSLITPYANIFAPLQFKDDHLPPRGGQKGKNKRRRRNRRLRSKTRQFGGIPGTSPIGGRLPYCPSGTQVTLYQYPYGECIVW